MRARFSAALRGTRDLVGAQRAAATDPNSGSALDLQLDAIIEGELAAMRAIWEAEVSATRSENVARAAIPTAAAKATGTLLGAGMTAFGSLPQKRPTGG